jgi:hypothetical protein
LEKSPSLACSLLYARKRCGFPQCPNQAAILQGSTVKSFEQPAVSIPDIAEMV